MDSFFSKPELVAGQLGNSVVFFGLTLEKDSWPMWAQSFYAQKHLIRSSGIQKCFFSSQFVNFEVSILVPIVETYVV